MKHTKGEWKVVKPHFSYCVVDENENIICQLILRDDEKANARLIAAAPDLLEALIEAQETINIFCDRNTPSDGSPNGRVMQKIIDAIKKAKGE